MHYCCLESGILASSQQTCLVGSCQHPSHASSQRTGGQGQGQSLSARPSSFRQAVLGWPLGEDPPEDQAAGGQKAGQEGGQGVRTVREVHEYVLRKDTQGREGLCVFQVGQARLMDAKTGSHVSQRCLGEAALHGGGAIQAVGRRGARQRERGGARLPCEGQGDEAVQVAQGHQGEVAGGLV